jgi:hypothetical protein
MPRFFETTVIGWDGETNQLAQWLSEQQDLPGSASRSGTLSVDPAEVITVEPFPFDKAVPQKCYQNVKAVIERLGGGFAFGWALGYSGPLLVGDAQQAPLYSRWVNHVVWRDAAGALWEVTPHFEARNHARTSWRPTIFVLDDTAAFEGCNPQLAQHTPLRPEGELVVKLLNQAQRADSDQFRLQCLRMAFAALESQGYTPKECRVESIGSRTSNIVLIAE